MEVQRLGQNMVDSGLAFAVANPGLEKVATPD